LYSGIIPALVTPFDVEDQVNTRGLCELVEYLLHCGVEGLYVCGSTGEGLLLTEEERRLVAETTVRQVAGRVPVIVHVGAVATGVAERLARHAREVGADAVASIPPFYYEVGQEGIEAHYRRISLADLPLYIYNIPSSTQVHITAALTHTLFAQGVIQGIKYTSYDMLTLRDIIETCGPQLNVFSGPDEMLLPFLMMGAHGGIGTTYNCMPRLFTALYAAWRAGDWARAQALQFQIDRIILVMMRYGAIPATKAAMRLLGLDCGDPRAPFVPLTDEQFACLRDELQAVGFFEWAGDSVP